MLVIHTNSRVTLQRVQYVAKTNVIIAVMLIALGCGSAYYFLNRRPSKMLAVVIEVDPKWSEPVGYVDVDMNAKILNIVANMAEASYPLHTLNIKFTQAEDKPSVVRLKRVLTSSDC